MRLFVAINFCVDAVEHFYNCAKHLSKHSDTARISDKENLHLTLAFIGETTKLKNAQAALAKVSAPAFSVNAEGFGEFKGRDGSLCFGKITASKDLSSLAQQVRDNLIAYGFDIDTKPFKPHITLCRQFTPDKHFQKEQMNSLLAKREIPVTHISLMKSERIRGRLVYTEIYRKNLA